MAGPPFESSQSYPPFKDVGGLYGHCRAAPAPVFPTREHAAPHPAPSALSPSCFLHRSYSPFSPDVPGTFFLTDPELEGSPKPSLPGTPKQGLRCRYLPAVLESPETDLGPHPWPGVSRGYLESFLKTLHLGISGEPHTLQDLELAGYPLLSS